MKLNTQITSSLQLITKSKKKVQAKCNKIMHASYSTGKYKKENAGLRVITSEQKIKV